MQMQKLVVVNPYYLFRINVYNFLGLSTKNGQSS